MCDTGKKEEFTTGRLWARKGFKTPGSEGSIDEETRYTGALGKSRRKMVPRAQ